MTDIAGNPPPLILPPGFSRTATSLSNKDLRRLNDAITRLHAVNARLWTTEDQVRVAGLAAEQVSDLKREIDQLNAERNALAERADEVLGALAAPHLGQDRQAHPRDRLRHHRPDQQSGRPRADREDHQIAVGD